jgi:hypothetical protein
MEGSHTIFMAAHTYVPLEYCMAMMCHVTNCKVIIFILVVYAIGMFKIISFHYIVSIFSRV